MHRDRSALFNLSAAAMAEAGTKAAQFATVVLIARLLGPEGFGIVGAAWALYQLAIPVVQGAPELLGMRNLSADRPNGARTVHDITSLKAVLALAAIGALCTYALVVYEPAAPGLTQTLVQALVLLGLAAMPGWAARSFQRAELYAVPRLAQACLFVLAATAGLVWWSSPLVVPLADLFAWMVAAVFGIRLLRPLLPQLSASTIAAALADTIRMRAALRGAGRDTLRLAAGGVAAAAIWWLPVLGAELLFGVTAGGHMAAAVRLVLIALVALHIGLQVFLPILAKYHEGERERFRQLAAGLAFYSTLAHLAVAAVVGAFAAPLGALVFGPGFEPAVPLILIFAMALVPLGLGSAYGYALIAAGRSAAYFWLSVAGGTLVLAGQMLGMIAGGAPDGVVWGLPFLVVQSCAFAFFAHAAGLVGPGVFALRRLAPGNIMRFLMER